MKKSKIISIITCLFVLFANSCGKGNSSEKGSESLDSGPIISEKGTPEPVYSKYYEILGGKDVLPIGTFSGPQIMQLNDETFTLIKESGIHYFTSTIDGTNDKVNANKFLELCDKYEIGVFLTMSALSGANMADIMTTEKLENALSEYEKYTWLMGFELQDEPNAEATERLNNTVRTLKNSSYSDYEMYYNAFPDYASPTQLSGTNQGITYEEYVRAYIENLEADYFSYDYYPFGKYGAISQGYFHNMGIVRNLCQEYEIPFWTFIQCGADFGYGLKECIPDEPRFRWNVATSLAYGAKGIQYFTLTQPQMFYDAIKDKDADAHTRLGMFGAKNNINEWYYYAKDANAHLAVVDEILMNSAHMGVIFHGTSMVEPSTGPEIISNGAFRQLTKIEGANAIIGCFDYKGGTALYVVNNSVSKTGTIALNFDNNYYYEIIKKTEKIEETGKQLTLTLDKGEGVLIVLK